MKNKTLVGCLFASIVAFLLPAMTQAQSAFFQAVTNLNPVAYWPLQETSQPPAADVEPNIGSLGAVANAYYSSTNIAKGVSGINSGDSDPAVNFGNVSTNSNGSFLAVPLTDNRVTLPAGAFSVEAWIYPTNSSASTILAQTGPAGSGGLNGGANSAGWSLNLGYVPSLNITLNGTVSFHIYNGTGALGGAEATCTVPNFSLFNWYHIVGVFDGTNTIIYVNAATNPIIPVVALVGTQARDTWDELTIGCGRGLNNNRFGGSMDEVAIYTNVLSAARVTAHYNTGNGGAGGYQAAVLADNPYIYWRMNAPAYTTPAASAFPAAINYGSGANINGLYLSGTTPGTAGPSLNGMGSPSYACAINGLGTDSANAIPLFTNGVAYSTNTAAETGVIITNFLSSMNLVTNNMTFICWFKQNPSDSHRNVLVGHSDAGWRTSMDSGGHVTANTGKGGDLASGLSYNDGKWHFAAIVYTNTGTAGPTSGAGWTATNSVYVDGTLVSSAFITNANASGTFTNISIGVPPDHVRTGNGGVYDNQVLAGSIAHVAFFTNALTAAQIVNLYTNATAGVTEAPIITSQPFPFPAVRPFTGGPGTFVFEAVVATGNQPLSYQWFFNTSSNYSGATALVDNVTHYTNSTTSQVTVTNLTDNDSGYYFAVVTDPYGGSVTSAIVNLQVHTEPLITAQTPAGGTLQLYQNQNYSMSVTVGFGETNYYYQWLTNGVADTSAGTNSSYLLNNVQTSMSGYTYQCIVTNLAGDATNALVTLSVLPLPPDITNSLYATNILALNPTVYFPMHETSPGVAGDIETNYGTLGGVANGTYADWNVNGGAPGNQVIAHGFKGALANDSDNATYFNFFGQTNSYLLVPHTSPQTTLTAPFTIECWMWAATGTFGDLVSQDGTKLNTGNANNTFGARLSFGPTVQVLVGSGTSLITSPSLTLLQWHHVALTTDGTNWNLYVDGSLIGTAAHAYIPDSWDPLTIGAGLWNNAGPTRVCSGLAMDEVAIYNQVLSAGTISTHYNDGISGSAGQYLSDVTSLNPLIYYRMDSPAYRQPASSTWPAMTNYGSAAVNGIYSPGLAPGSVTGPNNGVGGNDRSLGAANAAPCNGMSSYAEAFSPAAFDPAGMYTPFSVSMWFKGNPTDSRYVSLISEGTGWQINQGQNGVLQFFLSAAFNGQRTNNDGNWHQVVVTYSTNVYATNVLTMYIDGTLDAIATNSAYTNPAPDTVDFTGIGCDTRFLTPNQAAGSGRQYAGNVCEVAFWNGTSLTSNQVATLYRSSGMLPTITTQPFSLSVNARTAFTNKVVAYGPGTLTYQWYRNGTALPAGGQTNLALGGTNASLVINPVAGSDASANYYVVVSDSFGSTTSSVVSLGVFSQPTFTSEPVSFTLTNNVLLFAGAIPTWTVAAVGAQPVAYQWFTNGVAATASSAAVASYTMPPLQLNGVTNFFCVASNFVGMTTNTPIGITILTAPVAPYPQAVMLDKPAGYWRLNEANVDSINNGYLADDYWNANNGIYTNTILGQTGYNPTTDPGTTSAQFGSDSLTDGDAYGVAGVNFGSATTNSFSIEAWVSGFTQTKDSGIVSKGYGGSEQFDLDTGSDGGTPNHAFRFFVRDASGATHVVNSSIASVGGGGWIHLVGVCDESNGVVTLYINGVPVGSTPIGPGSGILAASQPMIIGSRPSSSSSGNDLQFVGNVNDVAVYNYALSISQVANHYASIGVPPSFTQLPATNLTVNGLSILALSAAADGTGPLTNFWTDLGASTNFPAGTTNGSLINASLTVSNVPVTWNGDTLQLTVANAYGSTNFTVTLTVFTNAPQFTLNLPPQVNVATGKPYTYSASVVGPQPYSYQWYNGASAIGGATNSNLPLLAGVPGSTTYSVVVTNVFGASTSSVSIFTSEAPPSGYSFASGVLALNPVGYWPLQETNAPAAAAMETNYGTLGRLGNAYYSSTNASVVNLAQTGALAGDPDTAAGFGIGQISYAVVPRISPELTIQAPFTLEGWVNTSNSTYGIIIGEGGGTGLNGATAFGGFQFGFGASEAQMQYYTGGNNTFVQFNSPASYGAGTWYHVVATYDGVNSTTYINGTVVATGTPSNTPDTWSPLCIGNGKWDFGVNGGIRQLAALIDEVAVYTNVLSPTRIAAHYNAGTDPVTYGAYSTNVLADQPMLYYRMDCPGYTNTAAVLCPMAVNFGSAPVNGAYLSATLPGAAAGPTNSVLGTSAVAVPINGLISCVDAGNDPSFNRTGTQPLTALTWFRTYPSDGRVQTIMSHGSTNWTMNLDGTTGHVVWSLFNAGQVSSGAVLNDGNWHFAAGVYDGANISLYVDGALSASAAASAGLVGETNADVLLGGNADFTLVGNNQRYFAGALAQAALFTNALTSTQIQSLYNVSVTPAISIGRSGGNLVITYTGRLLSSATVNGTYNPVAGAPFSTTPNNYIVSPTGAQLFYRAGSQ